MHYPTSFPVPEEVDEIVQQLYTAEGNLTRDANEIPLYPKPLDSSELGKIRCPSCTSTNPKGMTLCKLCKKAMVNEGISIQEVHLTLKTMEAETKKASPLKLEARDADTQSSQAHRVAPPHDRLCCVSRVVLPKSPK